MGQDFFMYRPLRNPSQNLISHLILSHIISLVSVGSWSPRLPSPHTHCQSCCKLNSGSRAFGVQLWKSCKSVLDSGISSPNWKRKVLTATHPVCSTKNMPRTSLVSWSKSEQVSKSNLCIYSHCTLVEALSLHLGSCWALTRNQNRHTLNMKSKRNTFNSPDCNFM